MARTESQVQNQINQAILASPVLNPTGQLSTSQAALWNLFSFIVSTNIATMEQLEDIYKASLEAEIASAAPGTPGWIVNQMLAFQYSATNPQVVQFVNGVPGYNPINPNLQIITHAAVVTSQSSPGKVDVKVAGADNTVPLTQNVASITITGAGVGYSTTPTVGISGGGGTGAAISPFPAPPYSIGQVIQTTNAGSGYTGTPFVTFTGGGASVQATAQVNLNSQLAAAQAYLNVIGYAGIQYSVVSYANDWLQINGTPPTRVQFDGQYTYTVIQANVQSAITAYLTNLPFNGFIILSDLTVAIKSVPGVIDLEFGDVTVVANNGSGGFGPPSIPMVQGGAVVQPQAGTISGTALLDLTSINITYTTNQI